MFPSVVPFHVPKVNLTINAGNFAPPEFETRSEVVQLTDRVVTLECFFQFCSLDRHPDLGGVKFDVLDCLAEAAEKYQVFSAMNICRFCMK